MKYLSQVYTAASGSIGGVTYSHNKGGAYTRARATPTNPNSPQQMAVRGIVGQLSNLWGTLLTAAQREAWDVYALYVEVTDTLGQSINLTGLNMYVRSNVPRIQAGLPRVDDGPTTYNLGDFSNPNFGIDATADELDVTFTDTDEWTSEDDAAMLLYASRPQSQTVNYFKGPYRFAGKIDGDGTTPPTSPQAIGLPFLAAAGQRIFVKASVTRADGRLSLPFRKFGLGA